MESSNKGIDNPWKEEEAEQNELNKPIESSITLDNTQTMESISMTKEVGEDLSPSTSNKESIDLGELLTFKKNKNLRSSNFSPNKTRLHLPHLNTLNNEITISEEGGITETQYPPINNNPFSNTIINYSSDSNTSPNNNRLNDVSTSTANSLPQPISNPIAQINTSQTQLNEEEVLEPNFNFTEEELQRRVVYDDFNAIDWSYDFAQERLRQNKLTSIEGWKGKLLRVWDASKAWWIVSFIGLTCGVIASFIDIVTDWLADIRLGYCATAFYNNQGFCCWGYEDVNDCKEWIYWFNALKSKSDVSNYVIQYLVFIITGCLFATLSAYLVSKYAPYAAGSGLPEIKTVLGGFIIRGFLGKWTLLIKTIGVCLSVASGLTLGKEGPLVHIACCVGNFFLRWFTKYRFNEAKKREILSAAAAAGISAAFGAPIGGVVYSLEEVSYYFPYKTMWRSFFCAMIAGVTIKSINPFRTGKMVLFQVEYNFNWHGFEMLFFLLLGVMGGLLGALFIHLNLKVTTMVQTSFLARFPVQLVMSVALLTSAISFPNIFMRVDAAELLSNLFKECGEGDYKGLCSSNENLLNGVLLTIAGLLKFLLAIVTYGLPLPAGFYMPAMMIGACLGRVMGILVAYWQKMAPTMWLFASCGGKPCISPGVYAMVGAAAMMGGMTRMTVSLVIIMFELTGALNHALPIMMAVMISKWVGDAFGSGGLTRGLTNLYGYPYLDPKQEYSHAFTAGHVMTRVEDLVTIPANGSTVASLIELLNYSNFKGFPIIKSSTNTMVIGYISRSELRTALELGSSSLTLNNDDNIPCLFDLSEVGSLSILDETTFLDLRSWIEPTPMTVSIGLPMDLVIRLFCDIGLRYVLVTKNGQLLGLISKKDVLRHLGFVNHNEFNSNDSLRSSHLNNSNLNLDTQQDSIPLLRRRRI